MGPVSLAEAEAKAALTSLVPFTAAGSIEFVALTEMLSATAS